MTEFMVLSLHVSAMNKTSSLANVTYNITVTTEKLFLSGSSPEFRHLVKNQHDAELSELLLSKSFTKVNGLSVYV